MVDYIKPVLKKKMATQRDREILNAIINPLLPIGEAVFDDDNKIPSNLQDEQDLNTEEYRYRKIAIRIRGFY